MTVTVPLVDSEKGLPTVTEEQSQAAGSKATKFVAGLMLMPRVITGLIAFAIYHFGDTQFYDSQIAALTETRRGYLYIGVGVVSLMVTFLNVWPTIAKAKLGLEGNLRANMMIYKTNVKEGKQMPYVVMEEEGTIGEYNRANRSLFNFNEWAASICVNLVCAGMVFPFPTMICACVLAVGRVMHQVGYAGGYGSHAPGFALSLGAMTTMEMLTWLAGVKSLMAC